MDGSPENENRSDNEAYSVKRREFLKKVTGIFTLLGSLIIGIPFIGSLINHEPSKSRRKFIEIANIDLLPLDEPTRISFSEQVEDAYIVETRNRVVWIIKHSPVSATVFSPICPHLGCSFEWKPEEKQFLCPCHGSVFTMQGKVVAGPSPRELDTLPQKIVAGNLYVEWERFEIGIPEKIVIS
ncbi:MAG: ubiquinol-cytochrome c reductase iron-sulfur subunit [Bacteroidales bacterium]